MNIYKISDTNNYYLLIDNDISKMIINYVAISDEEYDKQIESVKSWKQTEIQKTSYNLYNVNKFCYLHSFYQFLYNIVEIDIEYLAGNSDKDIRYYLSFLIKNNENTIMDCDKGSIFTTAESCSLNKIKNNEEQFDDQTILDFYGIFESVIKDFVTFIKFPKTNQIAKELYTRVSEINSKMIEKFINADKNLFIQKYLIIELTVKFKYPLDDNNSILTYKNNYFEYKLILISMIHEDKFHYINYSYRSCDNSYKWILYDDISFAGSSYYSEENTDDENNKYNKVYIYDDIAELFAETRTFKTKLMLYKIVEVKNIKTGEIIFS